MIIAIYFCFEGDAIQQSPFKLLLFLASNFTRHFLGMALARGAGVWGGGRKPRPPHFVDWGLESSEVRMGLIALFLRSEFRIFSPGMW